MSLVLSLPVVDTKIPSGVVLYDGPSNYTGMQIVVIATNLTKKAGNTKIGDMAQVWILVKYKAPVEANREGSDQSICGDCKHRHFRSCYVNLGRGPMQIYDAWVRGKYPTVKLENAAALFEGQHIRLGAYGDPAAVPVEVWDAITPQSAGWTGYTHNWMRCSEAYRKYCMASCDTLEEAQTAMERGWKPFYVRADNEPLPKGFFVCPASKEAGKRLTCDRCQACKGGDYREGMGVPSIIAHGSSWKRLYFHEGMKLRRNKKKFIGVFAKTFSKD